jgi:hypothetical protein
MQKLLILPLLLFFASGVFPASEYQKEYPEMFIGVWRYSDNTTCNQGYIEYRSNGTKISIGVFCDELVAYEAEWWVSDNYLHEKITKVIPHRDGGPILVGNQSKDKILLLEENKHSLKEKEQINTYVRLQNYGK